MSLTIAQMRDSLRQWMNTVTGLVVYVEGEGDDDGSIRPQLPYLALKFPLIVQKIGFDDNRKTVLGNRSYARLRQANASVDAFGRDAFDYLDKLVSSLCHDETIQFFSQSGFSFCGGSDVRDLSAYETSATRRRGQMDLEFYFANELVVPVSTIGEVIITGPNNSVIDVKGS